MDCFLDKSGPQALLALRQIETRDAALPSKMVEEPTMEVSGGTISPSLQPEADTTEGITQAVAAILAPTIEASVEKAVRAGVLLIKELGEHASRLNNAENRISNIEEELHQAQATQ